MKQLLFLFACCLFCLAGCSMGPLGGSGSQTTNGVVVATVSNEITIIAKSGSTVNVFSSGYSPFCHNYSDSVILQDSIYVFDSLQNGSYTVLVRGDGGKAVIFQDVPVDSMHEYRKTDSLQITGTISGSVTRSDSSLHEEYLIYIEGTPFFCNAASQEKFVLDSVPLASYNMSIRHANYSSTHTTPNMGKELKLMITISKENLEKNLNIEY